MRKLFIAATHEACDAFCAERTVVDFECADFTTVSAAVMTAAEALGGKLEQVEELALGIPVFAVLEAGESLPPELIGRVVSVINRNADDLGLFGRQIDAAAKKYEDQVLPPFFGSLEEYVAQGYAQFDCPGHQGGAFFRRHPAGREFAEFFGENVFRADLCNADVSMGDLLIHEGAPCAAQQAAAKIYNADKTYFVLNGTSASNKVVLNALLAPGDLVLFDRNNHKSNHHGALLQAGAKPVYLETARNAYGFIGGIDEHCFDEAYLRDLVKEVAPEKAGEKRPFRLAVIQLGTYDGTIYNARQVVDRIGHLCDYILFDSAWVGYEQFIPMMKDCSPLLLELGPEDPGIFVTQSVHKQQAGFSQTSQIHKKDSHIKGQKRYCPHKRLNNAFMMHASTSPFYALFAALDVNAKMHEGEAGRRLWADCVRVGIEARKLLRKTCKYIKPFVPATVAGQPWESHPTEEMARDLRFFEFKPGDAWHNFEGYGEKQYFVDPCKVLLTTPGIHAETGQYDDFGVPATILWNTSSRRSSVLKTSSTPTRRSRKCFRPSTRPTKNAIAATRSVSSARKCTTSTRRATSSSCKRKCSARLTSRAARSNRRPPTLNSSAATPSWSRLKTPKAASPSKAPFPILRACSAWSRAKSGAAPCRSTSSRSKKASTASRASRLNCRASTSTPTPTAASAPTAMS